MEKLGLNIGTLIIYVLNFAIIMVVLSAWLYKPLMGMLDKRKATVEKGLEDARVAAEARENAEKDAAKIMSDAQTQAAQTVRDATEKAEGAIRELRSNADGELAKEREAAMSEIQIDRERTLTELREQVAALAIAAAERLIGENLDAARQHKLLNEFFSGIKAGKVETLKGVRLNGASAEVTSALPLTDEEQATVKKELLASLEDKAKVIFHVDPAILGGLIVRAGDQVIDGSIAAQLKNLQQTLK